MTPLLVLAALAGLYLLALSGLGRVALGAYLVDNEETAARAAGSMSAASVIERYRGPFAEGTVAAAHAEDAADLAVAEELLREALALADPAGECAVRFNLALVLEAAAREVEAGEGPEAAAAAEAGYREAAAVAAAAPDGCAEVPSGHDTATEASDGEPERSAGDDLADAASRAAAAADAAAEQGSGESGGGGEEPAEEQPETTPPSTPSDRQDELAQRMDKAYETEQHISEDGDGEGDLGDGTADVPAPW
ncbi:hypothetical protein AA0Y32_00965 [Georgenia phoenicis]|uniref:hypothetical protein n=1 Tax=Georgenia sp. 1P07AB TaxID=554105 RepID=UPI0039B046B5